MSIENLAKKHANSLPGFQLVKYYEAAVPIHKAELNMTIQKKKPLGIVEEFILKLVSEGVKEIGKLADFLGLKRKALNNYIAIMSTGELVATDINKSRIRLTDKGRIALSSMNLIVPEDVNSPIYIDGLTGNVYYSQKRFDNAKDIRNANIASLSPDISKPTMDTIEFSSVKKALKKYKVESKDPLFDADLLTINDVDKAYLCYKRVSVLLFFNENSQEIEIKVFEKVNRVTEYEDIILKMQNKGIRQIKFDTKTEFDDNCKENILFNQIPNEVLNSAQELSANEDIYTQKIEDLEDAMKQQEVLIATVKNDALENESATQRMRELKEEIEYYKSKINEGHKILNTYDHRPLLISALKESREKVIIVSPWIKKSGLNHEIINLIEKALQRNVKVYIGYGISEDKQDSDKWIIKKLQDLASKKHGKNLHFIKLGNTHEKLLISDKKFVVITSFNWLSFRGERSWGFRQETGMYTESKTIIREMTNNIQKRMNITIED